MLKTFDTKCSQAEINTSYICNKAGTPQRNTSFNLWSYTYYGLVLSRRFWFPLISPSNFSTWPSFWWTNDKDTTKPRCSGVWQPLKASLHFWSASPSFLLGVKAEIVRRRDGSLDGLASSPLGESFFLSYISVFSSRFGRCLSLDGATAGECSVVNVWNIPNVWPPSRPRTVSDGLIPKLASWG